MAFCKLAVESHNWEIGVDSVPGEGAEFWIIVDGSRETGNLIADKDKANSTQVELTLSADEKAIIRPYLSKLSKTNIYSLSEIENLLSALKSENIKALDKWIREVIVATENLNEDNFKNLREQLAIQINIL